MTALGAEVSLPDALGSPPEETLRRSGRGESKACGHAVLRRLASFSSWRVAEPATTTWSGFP